MRVITGSARGRLLESVPGMEIRPTAEKVKEGIFSSIHFEVEGAKVLDLFCGSGQMGIEALSRGAALCVFVDQAAASIGMTKQNLTKTGLFSAARVIQSDVKTFLNGMASRAAPERFDIAFLDPPYSRGLLQEVLPLLVPLMRETGVILCEREGTDLLPPQCGVFSLVKEYRYGRIGVSSYRAESASE